MKVTHVGTADVLKPGLNWVNLPNILAGRPASIYVQLKEVFSYREGLVLGHLQPAVPRQRASQGSGEFANMLSMRQRQLPCFLLGTLISVAKREWRSTRATDVTVHCAAQ